VAERQFTTKWGYKMAYHLMKFKAVIFLLIGLSSCTQYIEVPYDNVSYAAKAGGTGSAVILDSPDVAYLKTLRKYLPDEITAGKSELAIIVDVTKYVSGLWSHNGWNEPVKSDPVSILEEVKAGKNFRCVEYAIVAAGFLNASGIPARVVNLRTYDMETRKVNAGHVVVECFSRTFDKWIMLDPQAGIVPIRGTAVAGRGIPLSIVEFQQAIFAGETDLNVSESYVKWIKAYLYYLETGLDQRYENKKDPRRLMLVPQGSKNPTVFQIVKPLTDMVYTNSLPDFYREPVIAKE
jgi:hypothetical protein